MSFIPSGYGEATLEIRGGPSDPINIVFGYEFGIINQTPNENAQNCYEAFFGGSNIWSRMVGPLIGVRCDVRETEGGALRTGSYSLNTATGSPGLLALPPNNAVLIRKVTAAGGRTGTGRMYVPAMIETEVDSSGLISGASQANIQAGATGMLGDMSTNDIPMYLLHDSALIAPNLVTSLSVQTRVATQRRRLR